MTSRRVLKVAQAIREVVGIAILTELKDPRIQDVTVTFVEVSADLRHAKVHVSVMGDEGKQNLSLRGLQNAAGFLQKLVSRRVDTRYTPRLQFVLDHGVKHALEVTRILKEVLPQEPSPGDSAPSAETDAMTDDPALAEATAPPSHASSDPEPDEEDSQCGDHHSSADGRLETPPPPT
jgi:ribosome-binding factor A